MKPKQRFTVSVTRAEFNKLPISVRRRSLALQADYILLISHREELLTALDLMASALAEHHHKWKKEERHAYEKAQTILYA